MYVCLCNAITESQVQDAINEGACDLACLRSQLGIASQCGRCAETASKMLASSTLATTTRHTDLSAQLKSHSRSPGGLPRYQDPS